jgi:DNA invertase Pin-like site-specific DNA recombinase
MKAYTYLRVSSKGQIEGDGPERQRLACAAFAKAFKIEIIAEFFDAFTGTAEDRPQFATMLESIDARNANAVPEQKVTGVIIERMDRLARDLMASEFLLRELRSRGIALYVCDQGQLLDMASDEVDPTRILIRQVLGALAQWEKTSLVKKLKAARDRAESAGKPMGNQPFGALPGELDTLRMISDLSSRGNSDNTIAAMLNHLQKPTRTGVPWTRHTIYGILARVAAKAPAKDLVIANLV